MTQMNSFYAHESAVGPVFDLARWSGIKMLWMGIVGLGFAALVFTVALFVFDPTLFMERPPRGMEELFHGIRDGHRHHAWLMRAALAGATLIGGLCGLGSIATLSDGLRKDYFLRAGVGGLAVRVPQGVSWRHLGLVSHVLAMDLPWEEISDVRVMQAKQLGAMSRNTGNAHADLELTSKFGQVYSFSLDGFNAPAYLIHQRLEESQQMTSVDLERPLVHSNTGANLHAEPVWGRAT